MLLCDLKPRVGKENESMFATAPRTEGEAPSSVLYLAEAKEPDVTVGLSSSPLGDRGLRH